MNAFQKVNKRIVDNIQGKANKKFWLKWALIVAMILAFIIPMWVGISIAAGGESFWWAFSWFLSGFLVGLAGFSYMDQVFLEMKKDGDI